MPARFALLVKTHFLSQNSSELQRTVCGRYMETRANYASTRAKLWKYCEIAPRARRHVRIRTATKRRAPQALAGGSSAGVST
jgi:hypothetical protein